MTQLKLPLVVELMDGSRRESGWAPMSAELRFSSEDPIAVTLTCDSGGDKVDWCFAFDLIHQVTIGLKSVGLGDVRFDIDIVTPGRVILRLCSPDGLAYLRINLADIHKFVSMVKPLLSVQAGEDVVAEALDKQISAILGGL